MITNTNIDFTDRDSCALCGAKAGNIECSIGGFSLLRCEACGFLHVGNMLGKQLFDAFYQTW